MRLPPGEVELRNRINEASIDAARAHLQAFPDDAAAYVALARQLEVVGRKSEAVDAVAKALLIEYGRPDWRLYRARLLSDLDRVPEAIDEVQSVLAANRQSEEAKALLDQLQDPKRRRKAP
jgi:tetratricopeptide (TPR) repeat protein